MVPKIEEKSCLNAKQKIANPFINITSRLGLLDAYSILNKYY